MITPTVGRVVWYWPGEGDVMSGKFHKCEQPCAAMVAHVNVDGTINLSVLNHQGEQFPKQDVLLYQGEGERPAERFAEWMPYQQGQARAAALGTESLLKHMDRRLTEAEKNLNGVEAFVSKRFDEFREELFAPVLAANPEKTGANFTTSPELAQTEQAEPGNTNPSPS